MARTAPNCHAGACPRHPAICKRRSQQILDPGDKRRDDKGANDREKRHGIRYLSAAKPHRGLARAVAGPAAHRPSRQRGAHGARAHGLRRLEQRAWPGDPPHLWRAWRSCRQDRGRASRARCRPGRRRRLPAAELVGVHGPVLCLQPHRCRGQPADADLPPARAALHDGLCRGQGRRRARAVARLRSYGG